MIVNLKKSVLNLLIVCLLASCNSATETKAVELKKDSTIVPAPEPPKEIPVVLKDIILNEKNLITGKKLSASQKIDKETYRSLSIKSIDSTANEENGFKYHIVDTLFSKPGLKILLTAREYDTENYAWITIYDGQDKLIDHKTAYYDNAEGYLSVETIIKNNEISITTYNEYENDGKKTTEKFRINENKIEKVK